MGVFAIFVIASIVISWVVLPILGVTLNVATVIILILNILFFLLLLLLRKSWKQAGMQDKQYIESFTGVRRFCLKAIRIIFTLGLVWEVLIIVICIALLVFQPLEIWAEKLVLAAATGGGRASFLPWIA